MRITPVIFRRDRVDGIQYLRSQPDDGCEWVLAGEGVATIKYDGRPILIEAGIIWARSVLNLEDDTTAPFGWRAASEPRHDLGLWPGWVPMSASDPDFASALEGIQHREDGSYELIGIGIAGNRHGIAGKRLMPHGKDVILDAPRTFAQIGEWLAANDDVEGIVYVHPNGDRGKIRRKDFGLDWPLGTSHDLERRAGS